MYKKIILGYDDSRPCRTALAKTSEIASQTHGKVFIVHAVSLNEEEFAISPQLQQYRLKTSQRFCSLAKQSLESVPGVQSEIIVKEGEADSVILQIAAQETADLIVLGRLTKRVFRNLISTNVIGRVITGSPCDVLIIKGTEGIKNQTSRSYLVPYDGSPECDVVLHRACEFTKMMGGKKITLLSVFPSIRRWFVFRKDEIVAKQSVSLDSIIEKARKITAGYGLETVLQIRRGDLHHQILKSAVSIEADLIIMGAKPKRAQKVALLENVTKRIINTSRYHVLLIK